MYKLFAFFTGDADAGDVGAGSPALPSAPTNPVGADPRKDKVQKVSNERNIAAGVVTQPHHSPQRSPTRKQTSPSVVEGGSTQSPLFDTTDSGSRGPPALKRVGSDDIPATEPKPTGLQEGRVAGHSATLYPGMLIADPDLLFNTVESAFLAGGMRLSDLRRKVKGSFDDEEEWQKLFNLKGFVRHGKDTALFRRGKWTCGHAGCQWNVAASYMSSKHAYEILDGPGPNDGPKYNTNLCLEHNHEIDYEIVDGVQEITSPKDLTDDEMEVLRNAALTNTSMPSVKHALAIKCGNREGRIYNSDMLKRVIMREKIRIHGTDHHRIPELMKRGRQTRQNGGEFEVDVDEVYRLVGTRFQTGRMKMFSLQYGSYFVIVDGTYGTNKYNLTLAPWVGADCLGHTVVMGISTSLSENTVDMVAAGRAFSLSSQLVSEDKDVSEAPRGAISI